MASLKDLRVRIRSVRSTQKITSAMKMVAAAKLRRAQEQALAARPYAERMERVLTSLAGSVAAGQGGPQLLSGTGSDARHLVIVATSDRGLCGAFNGSIVRDARRLLRRLESEGKSFKILCVGRKARDLLRRDYGHAILATFDELDRPRLTFDKANMIAAKVLELFAAGEFDVATVIYNRFRSAISQIVTRQQLIPFAPPEPSADEAAPPQASGPRATYEYEPDEAEILNELLPRNLAVQIFRALLENYASEQGARMTAMDNATRNAGDMIGDLTLTYNRTRQAQITKELIEIISGAEAI
jgi:F-type H+-transporting ATPase subunit gamma